MATKTRSTNKQKKGGGRRMGAGGKRNAAEQRVAAAKGKKPTKARTKHATKGSRSSGGTTRRKGGDSPKQGTAANGGGALAGLEAGDGWGAAVVVVEYAGTERERVAGTYELRLSTEPGGGKAGGGRKGGGGAVKAAGRSLARTCPALAAVGHRQRAMLLAKLLEGPATYQALQKTTGLKAGPLYHHVNQLRLAGLILPKQRDLYELTRGGRNLVLTAIAAAPLMRDQRRRPAAKD